MARARKKDPGPPPDETPVGRYIQGVLDGSVPACKWILRAVERHIRDLADGPSRGLRFDEKAAQRKIDFFGFLKHSKGEWAGTSFMLSPWQQFIIWVVYGWMQADGLRRFRTVYAELPRKNGKSTFAAGNALNLFMADGEPGAEVYCAATKRDQAKIVWGEAERMVKASPALLGRVTVLKGNLSIPGTASKLEPLGADEDTLDGLNPHASIIDELHAHKTRGVWDVLDTATGARRQPLQFAITTAGYDRHSICWEQHQYAEKVLDGIVEDDSFFAFIAALDEGDDWRDETTWAKANPNLGVSVKLDDLRRKAKKAQETPGYQNAFLRLHLNVWTEQAERWLDMARWDACAGKVDAQALAGRKCYGGLDLASTTDLAAFCLAFPPLKPGGRVDVLLWCWCPGEGIRLRSRRDKVPYDVWARQGFIAPTDGEVIDYEKIKGDIVRLGQIYKIEEIAFDRWGATQLRTQLEGDGFTMAEFGQGFVSMSAPSKELEKLVLGKRLGHGGNPVLRWMASNVSVRVDDAGNVKPSKAKSTGRIDGIVALIMSLARLSAHDGKQAKKSIYASRGMSFV